MDRTNSANELLYPKEDKSPINIPTVGRIVNYIPVLPDTLRTMNPEYCKLLPAITVEASDLYVNMVIFSMGSTPSESKFSVPHISIVPRGLDGTPNMSYWKWPNE